MGSGSASRRHRQARSGKASYKAPSDDEEFTVLKPRLPEGKDPARRNLVLKRFSRSQERDEALQIQRAIEASLSEHDAWTSDVHRRGDVDSNGVFHVTGDTNGMECFDCGPSRNASGRMAICYAKEFAKKEPLDAIEKMKRTTSDEVLELLSKDEDDPDEDNEDDASDYAISDVSEDSGRKRKKASIKPAIVTKDCRIPTAHANEACRLRTNSKVTSAVQFVRTKSVIKEKESKGTVKFVETASHTKKWQGSKDVQKQVSEVCSYGSVSVEASDILHFKSPAFMHRRIIGLSRRFKPPPLHPHLSHMQT